MRPSVTLLTLLASASFSAAHAQQSAGLLAMQAQPASCPVSLSVQQRSPTEVVRANDQAPEPLAQHLEIALRPHPDVKTIDSIEIRVRGVGSKPQLLPLGSPSDDHRADDLQQTFRLGRVAGTPTLSHSDIRVPGINAVRWVELLSVTYTDGNTWRSAAGLSCRSEPNRLLLVAGAN